MYDAPIPMINYVLATITASVLAYATAMDINENEIDGSATDNLPSISDSYTKEPEPEKIEEPEPEPAAAAAAAAEPVQEVPIADAQIIPQPEKNSSIFGGKRHNSKIKKTKRNAHNSKKRKQTRNKNHSK
jgi:hypothetical protein